MMLDMPVPCAPSLPVTLPASISLPPVRVRMRCPSSSMRASSIPLISSSGGCSTSVIPDMVSTAACMESDAAPCPNCPPITCEFM